MESDAVFILAVLILILFFGGEPDLMGSLIIFLNK